MNSQSPGERPFDERRSAAIRTLLVNVAEKGTVENRRYKNSRRARTIVPAAALALAITGGTVAILQAPVSEKGHVLCFARAERSGDSFPGARITMLTGSTDGTPPNPANIQIEDALSVCSDSWKQHGLDAGVPNGVPGWGSEDKTRSHPVPSPLTVCVWDGVAAVIPGGPNVCAKLGLAEKSEIK
jgi:hypothetical protein